MPIVKKRTGLFRFCQDLVISRRLLAVIVCGEIIILCLTALVFYELGVSRGETASSIVGLTPGEKTEAEEVEIYSIRGEVTNVGSASVAVRTTVPVEKTWEVKVGEKTPIVNYSRPDPNAKSVVSQISITDLEKGDEVVISSQENIAAKTTFKARSIVRMEEETK